MNHVVCVAPSPAVDVTYRLDTLRPGSTHRVHQVLQRGGGKGVNVARVLRILGVPTRVVVPIGGPTGRWLVDELIADGVDVRPVRVAAESRRTVTVVSDGGSATAFNEPGRPLTTAEWATLVAATNAELTGADALVISGSLPAGAPTEMPGQLVMLARDAGVPVVVDTSGPALLSAAEAGPDLIKPNAHELSEMIPGTDALSAARRLMSLGARRVVVSQGEAGLLGVEPGGTWRVAAVPDVTGNPTGAGDAVVAALVRGLIAGAAWPDPLLDAAALGAAAVLAEVAGDVDRAAYYRFLPTRTAERVA